MYSKFKANRIKMNCFNCLSKRFYHLTHIRSSIFTFHDQAPLPRKPVADNDKNVTVAGLSNTVHEEKPAVVLYPIKKSPADIKICEEMFSENPKETPPLFYHYDALQEPTSNIMFSNYNENLNHNKLPCQEGDDFSYHPFYMERPLEKLTPDVIEKLSEMEMEVQTKGPPEPKCPSDGKCMAGPIVVQGQATSKEE